MCTTVTKEIALYNIKFENCLAVHSNTLAKTAIAKSNTYNKLNDKKKINTTA